MKASQEDQIIELISSSDENNNRSPMIKMNKHEIVQYQVFIDEEIGEPKKYRDLISALYSAGSNDVFNIIINSIGGYLSSTLAIIEAIKTTNATVVAILTGDCHSAASIIALHCHNIIVTDSATMMIHTVQLGYGGNMHSVQRHADFSTKTSNELLHSTYEGFLTDKEMLDVRTGVELWLDSKEIKKHLNNKMKFLEEKLSKKNSKKPSRKTDLSDLDDSTS